MFQLVSDRLRVEIMDPGEPPNDTCRFDRTGCISEIILDGIHRFCAGEPNNLSHPCSGGRGIVNEYICDLSSEADAGEYYPKFGVGLIRKVGSEPYLFYNRGKYNIIPFPVHIRAEADAASFITEPISCLGYALRQEKRVVVEHNVILMFNRITNVGTKTISGSEYCHNFLTIDSMALGPSYAVSFRDVANLGTGKSGEMIRANEYGFTFERYQTAAEVARIPTESILSEKQFEWVIRNTDAGAGIRGTACFKPGNVKMWAADHMISVQVFKMIELQPGETVEWSRSWEFTGSDEDAPD